MLNSKYSGVDFFKEDFSNDIKRLVNQVWKLIPMREEGENWQKQLDSVIVEIAGLHEIFSDQVGLLIILSNLEGLRCIETPFEQFRLTIFGVIDILNKLKS